MELLQIATAQFIAKCDGLLLQIATAFLLQSATRFITNCDRYYKVRWIYYKLRQILQSAMIITNCGSTSGQSAGLVIRRSRVQVPFSPLAGLVFGSPEFESSTTFVNSQPVRLRLVRIARAIIPLWLLGILNPFYV